MKHITLIGVNLFDTFSKWRHVERYFKITFSFIACIYCFDILILTYSDFTFDKGNFDLRKRSGF